MSARTRCPRCIGTGRRQGAINNYPCFTCDGTGFVPLNNGGDRS